MKKETQVLPPNLFFAAAPSTPRAVQAQPSSPGRRSPVTPCWERSVILSQPHVATSQNWAGAGEGGVDFFLVCLFGLFFPDKLRAGGARCRAGSLQPLGQVGINSLAIRGCGWARDSPAARSTSQVHTGLLLPSARSLLPSGAGKDQQVERILLNSNNHL